MAQNLSLFLLQTVKRELPHLEALSEERACMARAPGKWSPKQELGHLLDSAVNNHIRFVRGALEPEFRGPGYSQDDWVRLHGYDGMAWDAIVYAWSQHNLILAALVNRIPEERLGTPCFIGAYPAMTLGFLIEDYVLHMQHHIDQLLRRENVTQYPGASLRS